MSHIDDFETGSVKKAIPLSDEAAFFRPPREETYPTVAKSGRARAGLLFLKLGVVLVCLWGCYQIYSMSEKRSFFQLRTVVLEGATHLENRLVTKLITEEFPANMMLIDLQQVCLKLGQFNWVQEVTVRRAYPDKLIIRVVERRPAVVARLDKLRLFDEQGVYLEEYQPSSHLLEQPILTGLMPQADDAPRQENQDRIHRYLKFLEEIDNGTDKISRHLSEVDLANIADTIVLPLDGVPRIHLGSEQFKERLERYFKMLPRIQEQNTQVCEVDMRYDDRIIVKPSSGR